MNVLAPHGLGTCTVNLGHGNILQISTPYSGVIGSGGATLPTRSGGVVQFGHRHGGRQPHRRHLRSGPGHQRGPERLADAHRHDQPAAGQRGRRGLFQRQRKRADLRPVAGNNSIQIANGALLGTGLTRSRRSR